MTFRVTILGSGSALPTPRRNPSAHVLNVHEQFFLVDCGEGTQARLMSCGINPLKINAVFISHLHGDHVYGLFGLISTLGLTGRRTPLQIFAPRPFDEILAAQVFRAGLDVNQSRSAVDGLVEVFELLTRRERRERRCGREYVFRDIFHGSGSVSGYFVTAGFCS